MKKVLFLMGIFMALTLGNTFAQKYALIDMEYILQRIPEYESANKEIEALSDQWQKVIDTEVQAVDAMYKKYQADLSTLSAEEKTKRENEIVSKENTIQELRNKYFGPEGDLFVKQEELIKPIQDEIYESVKAISIEAGYSMIIDRASASSVIFASPSIDISDQVLSKLGY